MSRNFNYEHVDGRCTVCGENKPVRWKNLYPIGSEGCDMCIECERQVLNFVRSMMTDHTIRRRNEFKKRREEKRNGL